MRVLDAMTTNVITVGPEDGLKEAARTMVGAGVSGLPVLDGEGIVIGMITEADFVEAEAERSWGRNRRLLDAVFGNKDPKAHALTVGEAMSKNPVVIDPESDLSEAARKMHERAVKRLPVVTPDGKLKGIISRADIMSAFARPDELIEDEIREDVLVRLLGLDDSVLKVSVDAGVVHVKGEVPNRSDARLLEQLSARLEGVVAVESDLMWAVDDSKNPDEPTGVL